MFKQCWHPAYMDCLLTLIISSKACCDRAAIEEESGVGIHLCRFTASDSRPLISLIIQIFP
jgi:hypothetical protein